MTSAPGSSRPAQRTIAALLAAAGLIGAVPESGAADLVASSQQDPRIRRVTYSPDAVVTVHTRRGQVTHIVLAPDEQIVGEPATGHGSDCRVEASTWCVASTEGRDLFIKPKAGATTTNLIVVSTKRRYAFELVPIETGRAAMRVSITLPPPALANLPPLPPHSAPVSLAPAKPAPLTPDQLVANRLQTLPLLRNAEYSVAVGASSEDIVPAMVWDDGRFTYFSFPGNRPLPAVFQTTADLSEEMVNVRMNTDGQLVADRVARRFVLRLGNAVVAVINEAFDAEGVLPEHSTAVAGVARVMRSPAANAAATDAGGQR